MEKKETKSRLETNRLSVSDYPCRLRVRYRIWHCGV